MKFVKPTEVKDLPKRGSYTSNWVPSPALEVALRAMIARPGSWFHVADGTTEEISKERQKMKDNLEKHGFQASTRRGTRDKGESGLYMRYMPDLAHDPEFTAKEFDRFGLS